MLSSLHLALPSCPSFAQDANTANDGVYIEETTSSLNQKHADSLAVQLEISAVQSENATKSYEANFRRKSGVTSRKGSKGREGHGVQGQHEAGSTPSTGHFYRLLQKSIQDKDLSLGKEVHSCISKCGLESNSFLGCHLIRMFTVFEDLAMANEVFRKLADPSVYAWTSIISAHASLGYDEHAVELYFEMRSSALKPDGHLFVAVLQACAAMASLLHGMLIHHDVMESGLESQIHVANTLIDMYAKCGSLQDARVVFIGFPERDVVTWNAIIGGYGHHEHVLEALELHQDMSRQGFQPNNVSYVCGLNACSTSLAIDQGKEMHAQVVIHGLDADSQVNDSLIDMYIKCDCLHDARSVFDKGRQDIGTFESMSLTYFQHGHDREVLELCQSMQEDGKVPTVKTFICSLRACSSVADLEQGWKFHSDIVESGFEYDTYVGNTLIDMYGKCSSLGDAQVVFNRQQDPDVVAWSALISGCVLQGRGEEAMNAFGMMLREGVKPNEITYACVLKACSNMLALEQGVAHGRWIHSLMISDGAESDIFLGGALVDMYGKCGDLEGAHMTVQKFPGKDVVIWTALITGYVQHGHSQEALQCFQWLLREGIEPNGCTLVVALKACSFVSALQQAKQIHSHVIKIGLDLDTILGSALIDTYSKCGSLMDACAVFDSSPNWDVVTWGTMLQSFAGHNDYQSALQCFDDMRECGHHPNNVIFVCLLSACCRANRVEEGCYHFKSMREQYEILPALEHYYSMVELLGHGGHVNEAEDLMESVPFQSNLVGWMSLLASCGRHGNLNIGRRCFEYAVRIEPGHSSAYTSMWNLYVRMGMLDDAKVVEELRISANAWKKPAKAFIEVDREVHSFIVGDNTHPQSSDIYVKLSSLSDELKSEGYSPCLDLVHCLGDKEDKEDSLFAHSEKLAIAFGLISTPEGSSIRVSKNLRMCEDCHSAAKAISKVERRDIIITDAYQTHHFLDGECSCVNRT